MAEDKTKTGSFVAIKCIDKKGIKGKEESLKNEIDVLRRQVHFSVRVYKIRYVSDVFAVKSFARKDLDWVMFAHLMHLHDSGQVRKCDKGISSMSWRKS